MKPKWIILIVGVLIAGGVVWFLLRTPETQAGSDASLIPLLQDENTAGYARALEPNNIAFPEDLGPHPEYQTEWWYYTGNVWAEDGERPFGYQLTFFRRALAPPEGAEETASDWRTDQIYLAHFTISDIAGEGFYPSERFSRGANGLAGAQAVPYRVWLEDWVAEEQADGTVRLYAETDDVMLDLVLTQTQDPVLHGDGGLSPKGEEVGNASYYYSFVQQETRGEFRIGNEVFTVEGKSWKDHEYSTSVLSDGAVGWDWFSLQFDNEHSLMMFQIRNEDGTIEPASKGTFIYPDGRTEWIKLDEWELEVTDTWRSPDSGGEYPTAWQLTIPELDLTLTGEALMDAQELAVSTTYWEGMVRFTGTYQGQPVTAYGYVEMTGYVGSMNGRL